MIGFSGIGGTLGPDPNQRETETVKTADFLPVASVSTVGLTGEIAAVESRSSLGYRWAGT
jgi:hypothetical protein